VGAERLSLCVRIADAEAHNCQRDKDHGLHRNSPFYRQGRDCPASMDEQMDLSAANDNLAFCSRIYALTGTMRGRLLTPFVSQRPALPKELLFFSKSGIQPPTKAAAPSIIHLRAAATELAMFDGNGCVWHRASDDAEDAFPCTDEGRETAATG
jgi:hypothetical protein